MMVAIVGPTACGKTDLALSLAQKFNGEIICADSRTIYRGMDIGTAKPTLAEQKLVRHHLLDVCEPGEQLSAAEFKCLAEIACDDIVARGKLPMVVGGSGLYLDALLYDYSFAGAADAEQRAQYDAMGLDELQRLLLERDSAAYERIDLANPRRVIRALEMVGQATSRRHDLPADTLLLGCLMSKEVVQKRVEQRINNMLEEGFIDEIRVLGAEFGWNNTAFNVIGYRAFKDVVIGSKTIDEAAIDFARGDMALYKKQVTWFKRNPEIMWLDEPFILQAEPLVARLLGV